MNYELYSWVSTHRWGTITALRFSVAFQVSGVLQTLIRRSGTLPRLKSGVTQITSFRR